jgi:hypothetical protein
MGGKAEGRRQKAEGAAARPQPPIPRSLSPEGGKGCKEEAARVHERLKERLGHCWRLETWEKKYQARIRVYGLEKCLIAVDGFVSQKWYVEEHSQDAPDLIFRSDKQLEKFLALGMKLPKHDQEVKEYQRKLDAQISEMEQTRARLEKEKAGPTARLQEKLGVLRDEVSEASRKAFIDPLLFVTYEKGVVILFHEQAAWVEDHYRVAIERALGVPVRVTAAP